MPMGDAAVTLRPYRDTDFPAICRLSVAEGWYTPVNREEAAREAWAASFVAFVAEAGGSLAGFVRCLSDGQLTLYVCELLVDPAWRGRGLLREAHALYPATRMDVLASPAADAPYCRSGFRAFPGFRATSPEH
jgi:GNAT superfamily N-acetyltransferase